MREKSVSQERGSTPRHGFCDSGFEKKDPENTYMTVVDDPVPMVYVRVVSPDSPAPPVLDGLEPAPLAPLLIGAPVGTGKPLEMGAPLGAPLGELPVPVG